MTRTTRPGPGESRALLPRSLAGSAVVHTALIGAGVLWGVLAPGGDERGPRAFQATLAAAAPFEPEPREVLEPLGDPELPEPELFESLVWSEPEPAPASETAEPPAPLRAADWAAERPLAIGTLAPPAVALAGAEPAPSAPPAPPLAVVVQPAPSVREPVARTTPAPAYPRLSRRVGEEGSVLCRLHLDAAGTVVEVEVVESSGHARLDEAARVALASWSFEPRREDGRAVPGSLLHRVTFRLREG